ncbi:MAG TPA: DEAD/DEAH box helicase [Thermoanaerobaculia bacterium]|nr:DEAD/DEAH box helicase [Thermoanaerobaculia bacterium]
MPVPDRYRSAFSSSTLKTIEMHASRFRVSDPLFFRSAYTANVTESERRTFQPVVVLEAARVLSSRCTCVAWMRADDLCRHAAVLLEKLNSDDGTLPAERFDASVWRAIAFASFSDGREMSADEGDPRETLLRKYVMTEQEQALLKRGSGSTRLQFEASPWYRWSKQMFLKANGTEARLELRDRDFALRVGESLVPLPETAVEHVVNAAPELVSASGFEIAPQSLTPSLRIEIMRTRALRFSPVLLGSGGVVLDRALTPKYGRFFFAGGRFASPAAAAPMFAEKTSQSQGLLFEVRASAGLPYDRETVLAEAEVFAFVERHREELAKLPPALAPETLRNAQPVRLEGDVIFDFTRTDNDFLEVQITFETLAGGAAEPITASEIAKARRDGVRALIRGTMWIDVTDPQFAWLDEATIGPRGQILVTKLELLRIRGSLRGKAIFKGDRACERIFHLFDEIQTDSDAPSPLALGLDLYAYQQTGYQWLWLLQQNGFGGLLCDDMGLGKTHQAIALIGAVKSANENASILIVCPTSLVDHWKDKLARYMPGVSVTLTTYGLVRSRIEQFRDRKFDLVVLDEMQTIKNADTATHHALRAIDKRIAVGLTGTPIENHEGELKALLDFVVPGYLPRHVDDRMMLQRLVRPFVLRRTKAQVLTQLPPKIVDKRFCELTTEQRALYRRVMEARAKPLRAQLRAGGAISYVHIFAALNYLKQICNHPASAGGGFGADVSSGKWEMFTELLDECMTSGLKVVVFSQYLSMLALIEDHLFRHDIGYASIKGATRERGSEIKRFHEDPDCRVFTASLRAGGLGIDLTSASVVIHYDRWWNQAREDQATDRVHRLGQNKGVQVIKLITRGTIEEKIDQLITRKGALATEIIRPDDPSLVKQFTRDELDELLAE